jgi:glycosyltransferase involved in cell wall biosynthesis
MDPIVSFVVPCYNYARYVEQAVDSLLAQTVKAIEVIVIDDASTDETPHVVERYRSDQRIQLVRHQVNTGNVRTYNEGLQMARGIYLGLVSADDFAADPGSVERQLELLRQHPRVGFVFSSQALVDNTGRVREILRPFSQDRVRSGLDEFRELSRLNYVPHSGTLVRRACHDELGWYDARLPHACDWDMWLRLCTRYDVAYIAEPLYAYRVHASNMSHRAVAPRVAIEELVTTIDANFALLPERARAEFGALRREARRLALFSTLWGDLAHGRANRAWAGLLAAVRRSPAILGDRAFYGALKRTMMLTCTGPRRYDRVYGGFEK